LNKGGPIKTEFDLTQQSKFSALGDFDGDGVPNINEWNAAADRATYLANVKNASVKTDGGNWGQGGVTHPVYYFNKANGHVYALINQAKTKWTTARDAAATATVEGCTAPLGTKHLATITDSAENAFVRNCGGRWADDFHIGIYDNNAAAAAFDWKWLDGTATTNMYWDGEPYRTIDAGDEPNNPTTEFYGEMRHEGYWNNISDGENDYYMVEFDGPFADANHDSVPDGWEGVPQDVNPGGEGEGEGEGEPPAPPCEFLDTYTGQFAMFADQILDIDVAHDFTIADALAAPPTLQGGLSEYDLENLYKFLGQVGLPGDGIPDLVQMKMVEYALCNEWHPLHDSVVAGLDTNKTLFVNGCNATIGVLQGQMEALQGQLDALDPENPAHADAIEELQDGIDTLNDFVEILYGLSAAMPDYIAASVGTSATMRASWEMLFKALTDGELGMPVVPPATIASYVVFTGSDKAAGEPFSGDGDFDGDGISNADEYAAVSAVYTDPDVIAEVAALAITDSHNLWPGNPEMPVGGMVGLGLLASALVLGGRLAIRKK
jgi:hypothetical protein